MNGYIYNMSPKTMAYPLTYCSDSDARYNTTPCTIPTLRNPLPHTLYPRKNGQPSPTPHHRSGKLPTSSNTLTLIFPSKATTPWLNS
jgi:hypothetical protein